MKEFIEFIAKHLVDKPEEVEVTEAIRTLLSASAAKIGKRAVLEILE